jgi:glucokinase
MTHVLDGRQRLLVGVDVGGSKIAVLVVDPADAVHGRVSRPTAIGAPDGAADAITASIDEGLRQAGATRGDVAAVGVGVPGRVDPGSGDVTLAVNLGWDRLPLGSQLTARIGAPVSVENDVRAAAAGLHARRVLGAVDNLAYLGIGTGISAGVVLGGRLHRGARGLAGEIGHSVLDPDGPRCACGLRGCFEALAAGPAIARRAGALLAYGYALGAFPGDGRRDGAPTAEAVYAAAAAGDAVGTQIADEVGRYVARAVHELVMAYDVEVVVLGGGVAAAGDAFFDPILRALDRLRAQSDLAREVLTPGVVHLLPPSAEAGTWGAVTLAAEAARRAAATGDGRTSPAAAAAPGRGRTA